MFIALDAETHKPVYSCQLTQPRGPFLCRMCLQEVEWVYDSRAGVGYFEHKKATRCTLRKKSDSYHRQCKLDIYQSLFQFRIRSQIECMIKNNICSDLFVEVNGHFIAIEIERPSLTSEEVERVTEAYTEKSIPVLWLMLNGRPDKKGVYQPKEYERTIAEMRNGVVLFWRGGIGLTIGYLAPHYYYPSKLSYEQNTPKMYKRTNRILFGTEPVSITSLIPKLVRYRHKTYLLAVEPNLIRWPVLEKPSVF